MKIGVNCMIFHQITLESRNSGEFLKSPAALTLARELKC